MIEIFQHLTDLLLPISATLAVIAVMLENTKKIAINPISAIFRWIGKKINGDHNKHIQDLQDTLVEYIKQSSEKDLEMQDAIENIKKDIDDNERDRIRAEIFRYGRIARENSSISTEEWRHIQNIYYKYHDKLCGNGQVTEEYKVIKDDYESQFKKGTK